MTISEPLERTSRIPVAIRNLELSRIREKLMKPRPSGRGWDEAQASLAEKWYRRFLMLVDKYPEKSIVPNAAIDAFWHQHILDTRAYAEDCELVFGRFVHHYPYYGLDGDEQEAEEAYSETKRLYVLEFGEDCEVMDAFLADTDEGMARCNNKCSDKCRPQCKRGD